MVQRIKLSKNVGLCSATYRVRKRSQVSIFFCLRLLATLLFATTTGLVSALPNQEPLAQREWTYEELADVVTGDPYPGALLFSRNIPAPHIGHGYLEVGNYSKRPMEVTLSWDESAFHARAIDCKPGGCEVRVRFGGKAAVSFIATRNKYSATLSLQNGNAFLAEAIRHTGPIEVQVETVGNGRAAFQFATTKPLQVEKLTGRKR